MAEKHEIRNEHATSSTISFGELPMEILLNILEFLTYEELLSFSLVSHKFYAITQDDRVWRSLCHKQFNCQQHIFAAIQMRASKRCLTMQHLPNKLREKISPESLQILAQAGIIFDNMKNHYLRVRLCNSKKSFLQRTIFQAAMELTFGYLVHSNKQAVGSELTAAIEHCTCEWKDNLLERVLDHSKIPDTWKSMLLCKIYWTCCLPENSELAEFFGSKHKKFCIKESEGKAKLGYLLEKATSQHLWIDTSELLLDTLLLLGGIPSRVCIKRALTAICNTTKSLEKFKKIFPKLLFALDYSTNELPPDADDELYLSCTLEKYEISHGEEGDLYYPIHIAASSHNLQVILYLVNERGISINQRTSNGNSPLSILLSSPIVRNKYSSNACNIMEIANACVELGAEIDSIVLRAAVQGLHWSFVDILITKYQIDPCIIFLDNKDEVQTPLHYALRESQMELAITLLDCGVEIFQLHDFNWLMHSKSQEFYQMALNKGTNWNDIRDSCGRTSAHILASCKFYLKSLQLVVMVAGSIIASSIDNHGNTPIQLLIAAMTEKTPLSLVASFLLLDKNEVLAELRACDELETKGEAILVERLVTQIEATGKAPECVLNVQTNSGLSLLDKALFLNHEPILELFLRFNSSADSTESLASSSS